MTERKKDYEVGFGRPPKETQFKKGQSGNSKGRPKGARGFKTDLKYELSQRMTISENGKSMKLSKQQIILKQLAGKAMKGDIRAINKLTDLAVGVLGVEDEPTKGPASLALSKQAILDSFLKRQRDSEASDDS